MLLLDRRLALVEQRRLVVVLGEFLRLAAHLVLFRLLRERGEALHARLERAAAAERIRLVCNAPARNRLTMHAIALVVVNLRHRGIDRDLVEIRPAQPRDLRVDVRVDATGEQRIVAEVQPRHDVRRTERNLLRFREEVVGVAVQHHAADRRDGHELLRNELGRVEHVETEFRRVGLAEDLHAELPLRISAGLDRFPQVAAVKVRIGAGDLHGFIPRERVRARQRIPVELDELRVAGRVHEAKRVDAEALHHPVAARNRPVGHHPQQHVRAFRHQRNEVPERVVRGSRLRHPVVRLGLNGVNDVRELHRILDEEHRDVVADQIPVAFVGVELDREAAHVARRIGGAAFARDGGEAHEDRRALACFGKDRCLGQLGQRLVTLEKAVRARTASVHYALRNALMIEVRDLLAEDEVLQ